MLYATLLRRFTEMSKAVLQDNLVGIYLHGSAAMGCMNPQKSDLDLILVVAHSIPDAVKLEFMQHTVALNQEAPAKGLELSIVKKEFCQPFVYPTPFELHFSITHLSWFQKDPSGYIEKMQGVDPDLAAHFTVLGTYGTVLYGPEISTVFAPVPKSAYLDSIWGDIENACTDVESDPVYVILNLCRVFAYVREELVLSKDDGGQWGLKNLPERYHILLKTVLYNYRNTESIAVDIPLAQDFSGYMLDTIQSHIHRKL